MSGTAVATTPLSMVIDGERLYRGITHCTRCNQPHEVFAWDEPQSPVLQDVSRRPGRRTSDRCSWCIVNDLISQVPCMEVPILSDRDIVLAERETFLSRNSAIGNKLAEALDKLAKSLGQDDRLFDLGRLRVSRNVHRIGVGAEAVRELVFRHVRGDFGEEGQFDRIEVDAESEFFPMARSRGVANRVAIARKDGLVASRYRAESPLAKRGEQVQVVTAPGRPTWTFVGAIPADLPKAI